MNQGLLEKILDSNISRSVKEEILRYWLLPKIELNITPIQRSEGKSGAVKRPSKEQLDLKKNPKIKEEQEEMEKTLEGVIKDDENQ